MFRVSLARFMKHEHGVVSDAEGKYEEKKSGCKCNEIKTISISIPFRQEII